MSSKNSKSLHFQSEIWPLAFGQPNNQRNCSQTATSFAHPAISYILPLRGFRLLQLCQGKIWLKLRGTDLEKPEHATGKRRENLAAAGETASRTKKRRKPKENT